MQATETQEKHAQLAAAKADAEAKPEHVVAEEGWMAAQRNARVELVTYAHELEEALRAAASDGRLPMATNTVLAQMTALRIKMHEQSKVRAYQPLKQRQHGVAVLLCILTGGGYTKGSRQDHCGEGWCAGLEDVFVGDAASRRRGRGAGSGQQTRGGDGIDAGQGQCGITPGLHTKFYTPIKHLRAANRRGTRCRH